MKTSSGDFNAKLGEEDIFGHLGTKIKRKLVIMLVVVQ
jgi:hypothetical protein